MRNIDSYKTFIMQRFSVLALTAISIIFASCSDEEPALSESFLKIYDHSDLDLSYEPIDVVETVDGFIVLTGTELSNTDFMGVQLVKIDEEGNYRFDSDLDYVVPVGDMYLNAADSNTYFFAMNDGSLEAVLISVNPNLEIQSENAIGGINYPLSSAITSAGTMLLQSYDPLSQETEISEISLDGGFSGGARYSIGPGDDVEEEIINHYLRATERPLPFFCGEISSGNYFFNGFFNYSFSLTFTNFGDSPQGVVQGQASNAGIRAAMALGGSEFAVAGYQFDENYQLSSATLSTSGISSSADLYPGDMAEIKPYTKAKIVNYSTGGSDYTVFASETKSNQVALHFYNATTGEIDAVHHIGYLNPFSFASIKVTSDNALIVLGTSLVAGRFERIMLNKISESELQGMLN
ncbi:MAG: hypothetical protein Tsb0034_21420 [Ekhidna sp.]